MPLEVSYSRLHRNRLLSTDNGEHQPGFFNAIICTNSLSMAKPRKYRSFGHPPVTTALADALVVRCRESVVKKRKAL
jgi:hypothetical protein